MSNSDFIIEASILKAYRGTAAEAVIPDGVKVIGGNAFADREGLAKVTLPESLEKIEDGAFRGCKNLSEITGWDKFGFEPFRETAFFMNYLDQSRLMFGEGAFPERHPVTEGIFLIPEGVCAIGIYGLLGCAGIKAIHIPKTTELIYDWAFSYCPGLASIDADPENPAFASADGVLFTKNMTRLIAYPAGKTAESYAVPDGVVSIAEGAFAGCGSLKKISLPESLSQIGKTSFDECSALEDIIGGERFHEKCFEGTKWYENRK